VFLHHFPIPSASFPLYSFLSFNIFSFPYPILSFQNFLSFELLLFFSPRKLCQPVKLHLDTENARSLGKQA
jgi:hypothetical protein